MNIPNLTPLRFFLALLVLVFHTALFCKNQQFPYIDDWAVLQKGMESVYVFFALSGFLIIGQLYAEKKQTGKIRIKRFYIKRIFRILPLYYLVLFIGFFYYRLLLPHLGFSVENNYNFWEGFLLSVTLFANVFAKYSPGGIIEILWSIAIEEQFYLFIAPILAFISLKAVRPFLVLFSVFYLLLYFSGIGYLEQFHMLFFFFSFGGLAGIFFREEWFKRFIRVVRFFVLPLALLYFTTNLFKDNLSDLAYFSFSAILFPLVLSSLALFPFSVLECKPLYLLGDISYAIYLFHPIAMQAVGFLYLKISVLQRLPLSFALFTLLVAVLTVAAAYLSKRYFESYFLRLREKFM